MEPVFEQKATRRVFVYGTLLRGEPNHDLLGQSPFLGEARTEPVYSLVNMGPFPAMVREGSTSVVGEVYEVTNEVLEILDALEGHPQWYYRTTLELTNGIVAEAYLLERSEAEGRPVIASGDWRELSRQSHQ